MEKVRELRRNPLPRPHKLGGQHMDIVLFVGLWLIVWILSILFYNILPVAPRFGAYALSISCVIGFVGGYALMANKLPKFQVKVIREPTTTAFLVLFGMMALSLIAYLVQFWFNPLRGQAETVQDIRRLHVEYRTGIGPIGYFVVVTKFFTPLWMIFLAFGRFPWWTKLLACVLALVIAYLEAYTSGGRMFLKLAILYCLSVAVLNYGYWLRRHLLFSASVFVLFCLSILLLLTGYNLYRGGGHEDDRVVVRVETSSRELLDKAGYSWMPDSMLLPFRFAYGYAITPISYLQHFINTNEIPPRFGVFQFNVLGRRLGYFWLYDKVAVDHSYFTLGITHNIWATGLREMVVDFGLYGVPFVFFLAGIIYSIAKHKRYRSLGAYSLCFLILMFMLNTPFESLFKDQSLEMALYFTLLVIFLERSGLNLDQLFWKTKRMGTPIKS